jgi:hypothetical protein
VTDTDAVLRYATPLSATVEVRAGGYDA